MSKFKKIVFPGIHDTQGKVFCYIEYDGKKLSISGVEGPYSNGDCKGSSGQMEMHIDEEYFNHMSYNFPEWTDNRFRLFVDIWRKWHLNDMRAGCVHQRQLEVAKINVYHYQLTSDVLRQQLRLEKDLVKEITKNLTASITKEQQTLLTLPWRVTDDGTLWKDEEFKLKYDLKKLMKDVSAFTISCKDHPQGMLGQVCPVCGYKYGHSWLFEEVPKDALDFLIKLPDDTFKMPSAWSDSFYY